MQTLENVQINWTPVIQELEKIVGQKNVIKRKEELLTYECDGLTSYKKRPNLVVLPKTTEDVVNIVKICDRYNINWIARGAGTGLSGGAFPTDNCILIVTSLMNKILKIDLENQFVVVQPGIINNWVTQAVSGAGFYYAPDPSSQVICSIGGNVAENSGGVHCLKYGVTTNHILGLKLVLPDGEIVDVGGEIPEMPGYDLTGLFVGSEGTLGIATEVTLRILKTPQSVCVIQADFNSIENAANTVSDIIASGIIPGGMEMMDNMTINAAEDYLNLGFYPRDAAALLLVEIDGIEVEVMTNKKRVIEICQQNQARSITTANDLDTRLKLWKGRKAAFPAMGKLSPDYYVQDGVIPRTKLTYVLQEIQRLSEESGYKIANVFHAGDGNLHPLILYNNAIHGQLEDVEKVGAEILKLCVKVGGSLSGEHGIGEEKKCYMPEMFTDSDLETMIWIRNIFNPKGLANPEKMFPTPKSCGEGANSGIDKKFPDVERF